MRLVDAFRTQILDWTWEEIAPSSGSEPTGNRGGALFTRNGSGVFCLLGGRSQSGLDRSDLWTFDLGTRVWTQVVSSGLVNVWLPSGYADGSGNIFATTVSEAWDAFLASTQISKINVSTGAQTFLADSGTGVATGTYGHFAADPSTRTVFVGRYGTFSYEHGITLVTAVQDPAVNTTVKTSRTTSGTGRIVASSLAYYPAGNTLYCVTAPSTSSWTLATNCVYKYDLALGTGWVQETGITNSAGAVGMPGVTEARTQMIWSATESKFFIFVSGADASCARVLTYDPVSKVITQLLFGGTSPAHILGTYDAAGRIRGNLGTVVESSGQFFFCTCVDLTTLTNARIWRLRRT